MKNVFRGAADLYVQMVGPGKVTFVPILILIAISSGVLAPGRGNRLVLANTEHLHDHIERISARNRELESALRMLQESVSDQPHPLLSMDVLRINTQGSSSGPSTTSSSKSPSTSRISPATHPPNQPEAKQDDEQNVIDAFGVQSISRPFPSAENP